MHSTPSNTENNITFYIDDIAIELIYVEGTDENGFIMGGESGFEDSLPEHPVYLSSYYIGKYLVTQALWEKVMGKEANTAYFKGNKNHPMENISWEEIMQKNRFMGKLNRNAQIKKQIAENKVLIRIFKDKEISKLSFDLPSEAQWEYAARARTEKYKYAGNNNIQEVVWYDKNSHEETKPVGLKKPNGLGIYDMNGNVWEWCKDLYDKEYYQKCFSEFKKEGVPLKNPCNETKGGNCVVRGGSWYADADYMKILYRSSDYPADGSHSIGFRLLFT